MRISPAQSRAARAFLQWSQAELEKQTGVCIRTIHDFECEVRQPHERTLAAICNAFESHGVEFLPQDRGGEGVQFKKAHPIADHRKEGRRHGRAL
jgi:transcriptional regulator with XRE-family HTH domain